MTVVFHGFATNYGMICLPPYLASVIKTFRRRKDGSWDMRYKRAKKLSRRLATVIEARYWAGADE